MKINKRSGFKSKFNKRVALNKKKFNHKKPKKILFVSRETYTHIINSLSTITD